MQKIILYILICLLFSFCVMSCNEKEANDEESVYKAIIIWESDLVSNALNEHTIHDDYIYFYERPPGHSSVNIYTLTKLDANTGGFIWRSEELFSDIVFCQPIIIDEYVYVFLEPNYILCSNKDTGEHTTTIIVDINNQKLKFNWNTTNYKQYIYIGLYNYHYAYFARINTDDITHGSPEFIIDLSPEILWVPETENSVSAKQVFHNNTVYTSTYSPLALKHVELAGFDINTKEIVFYKKFGGPEDIDSSFPEKGSYVDGNPILINGDIIYYLSCTISAWNLNTRKQLYRHTFNYDIPDSKWYTATNSLQPLFYNDKIYYTSGESYTPDSHRNTYCIDAKTGKLVWSAIAKNSESLRTNPIIANGKLFVSQYSGLRVYNPENGRLIGVDKSFCGQGSGRNILYNDFLICLRSDRDTGDSRLVAVYVGE